MSTNKPPQKGFRETSWFAEGARKSALHQEAAATGEELPEDHRTLEERYQPANAPVSVEENALSLRTGTTGARPAVDASGLKKQMFQRDTAGALKAVVRTPAARFVRTAGITLLALLVLTGSALAAFWFSPGFAAWVRSFGILTR
jgi:hypothetical protein